jgi:hypothetical protein
VRRCARGSEPAARVGSVRDAVEIRPGAPDRAANGPIDSQPFQVRRYSAPGDFSRMKCPMHKSQGFLEATHLAAIPWV